MDEAQVGAGTNAYMVAQWARGTRLVMEPNWMYWEHADFNLNRVVVDLVEETQTLSLIHISEPTRPY